jgi:hypothetical protein
MHHHHRVESTASAIPQEKVLDVSFSFLRCYWWSPHTGVAKKAAAKVNRQRCLLDWRFVLPAQARAATCNFKPTRDPGLAWSRVVSPFNLNHVPNVIAHRFDN